MKNVNTFVENIISPINFENIESKYSCAQEAAVAGAIAFLSDAQKVDLEMYRPLYTALINRMKAAPLYWASDEENGASFGALCDELSSESELLSDAACSIWTHLCPGYEPEERQAWEAPHYANEFARSFVLGAANAALLFADGKGTDFETDGDIEIATFFQSVSDALYNVAMPLIWSVQSQREAVFEKASKI